MTDTNLNDILGKRPLIFDGAMGTMLQMLGTTGICNEELCLSNPKRIIDIHRAYLDAGADVITTNSFGASRITLADHGLASSSTEINLAAAKIAKAAALAASTSNHRRYVAGELGPTSKLPTLGHISFNKMFDAYFGQVTSLIDGGADLIIIATCQDPLQAKAAAAATRAVFEQMNSNLPLFISVTVEKNGTMLLGTELFAALAALAPYRPDAFGINCSTGPQAMEEHLKLLSGSSPFPIICKPNAGMPENIDGRPVYSLSPADFAESLASFAENLDLAVVGGCCGTTPEHISALVKCLKNKKISRMGDKRPASFPFVSSLYTSIDLDQMPRPFIVAEQTNANGSKLFRDLLSKSDYDAMAEIGKKASASCHALDICVAFAGRDEKSDMSESVRRLVPKTSAALMIDSTDPDTIETALTLAPGRAIINSINLEDGGNKAKKILSLARKFGAAVVGLTIDENGMAKSVEEKLRVARRITALVLNEGLSAGDLLIDPLTFTLASGDRSLHDAGKNTLSAIAMIKGELKGVRVILGVSNISFGLTPQGRRVLTSVFLHRAVDAGLDAAIINPARIVPLSSIPANDLLLCERLIDNDRRSGDPLMALIDHFSGADINKFKKAPRKTDETPAEMLTGRIIEGSLEGLSSIIEQLMGTTGPADILNSILLPAMQEVGVRFGAGKLPLPFVLQSAEAMRAACDLLAPHLKSEDRADKGTIIIATVRGDVHDIGKNLVDAILSNNGFRVINLGIRQPAETIMEAAREHGANAIGLSGLLVSSTQVMKEDLELFKHRGLTIPVLCGGAALTRSYVEKTLAPVYSGKVYYCPDAFAGLSVMEEIGGRGAVKS